MKKINVQTVTTAPGIGKPEMLGGIRSKEAAAEWADKNGYATVYWFKSRERVYADKLTKQVDVLAEQLATWPRRWANLETVNGRR